MSKLSPEEEKLPWVWWERDEPEDDLLGFHTKEDLERFRKNLPGPYRRRISNNGRTISQLETWDDMMKGIKKELGE